MRDWTNDNLITVPLRPGQRLKCEGCGKMGASLADLSGPAFVFWHEECLPPHLQHKEKTCPAS